VYNGGREVREWVGPDHNRRHLSGISAYNEDSQAQLWQSIQNNRKE